MIDTYQVLVWAHILMLVFWLGTDIGVFVSAVWMKHRVRSASGRILLLQLGGLLDVMPRLCAALMFPLGVSIARQGWGLQVSPAVPAILWLIALIWCIAIIVAYRNPGSAVATTIGRVQQAGLAVAGTAVTAWGVSLLGSPDVPSWLALKVLLFGFVYFLAMGIDLTFRPVIALLQAMPPEGGTEAQERAFSAAINRCCAVVLALYAVVVASSALGTMKPPI